MSRSNPRVELVYERGCPNIERARVMIRAALLDAGADPVWHEWDRDDAGTPLPLRRYGSPTVLVNGRDVGCDENATAQSDANACRVYIDESGCACGAPSARLIVTAIRRIRVA
jgi:mercuric ion transport protein